MNYRMSLAIKHLDKRLSSLRGLSKTARPERGWLRAIREALGMTTGQFAKRIGVSQPRVIALEKAEVTRAITLHTLERAAEALGCRVVYVLVPDQPLATTLRERALSEADKQLAAVQQTMRLEAQAVASSGHEKKRHHLAQELMKTPARLWDDR